MLCESRPSKRDLWLTDTIAEKSRLLNEIRQIYCVRPSVYANPGYTPATKKIHTNVGISVYSFWCKISYWTNESTNAKTQKHIVLFRQNRCCAQTIPPIPTHFSVCLSIVCRLFVVCHVRASWLNCLINLDVIWQVH